MEKIANFVTRTIKNGRVKINGNIYKPDEKFAKYDGWLDGMRYIFGLYEGEEDFVSMWGKEEVPNNLAIIEEPEIINGTLPWYWWHKEKQDIRLASPFIDISTYTEARLNVEAEIGQK